jgi:hypothetical protein
MKINRTLVIGLMAFTACFQIFAQPITYQGRLETNGTLITGPFDLRFAVFDISGPQIGPTVTNTGVGVTNGLFTTLVDFGSSTFNERNQYLEIAVRPAGSAGAFTTLSPRQLLAPAPKAHFAYNAAQAYTLAGNPIIPGVASFTAFGSPPFFVNSSVTVANLSADLLDGLDSSAFWKLTGNNGTTPGTHFLGTADNQSLTIKVNGITALRIDPAASAPNIVGGLAAFRPTIITAGVRGAVVAGGNAPAGPVNGFGGGDFHAIYDSDCTIGGGFGNKVGTDNLNVNDAPFGTVAGGVFNGAANYASTVAGGDGNLAGGVRSAVLGGAGNQALATDAAVSGGQANVIQTNSSDAIIGGGAFNRIQHDSALGVIAGGQNNTIVSNVTAAVISGGTGHLIDTISDNATIAGGGTNIIGSYAPFATISGGGYNTIANFAIYGPTIAGGMGNTIDDGTYQGVICGGYVNHIHSNADNGVISGGYNNHVRGSHSVVPGGRFCEANGAFSFAAGYDAIAAHDGSFVWAGAPNPANIFDYGATSTGTNQFVIRALGGIQVYPNTSMFFGAQTRQMLNLWGTQYGIGVQSSTLYSRCDGNGGANAGFSWYKGGVHNDAYANAGGGIELMHLIDGGLYVHGTYNNTSDRNEKENFTPVEPREVLEKVAGLPITRWNYKHDAATPHLGPVAQDFYAAFGVGPDDKHIATVDESGVALAAIQGLNEKVETRSQKSEDRIQKLESENLELRRELETLKRAIGSLADSLNGGIR